jgi:hypothetical protein
LPLFSNQYVGPVGPAPFAGGRTSALAPETVRRTPNNADAANKILMCTSHVEDPVESGSSKKEFTAQGIRDSAIVMGVVAYTSFACRTGHVPAAAALCANR